jgi:hypothetical protein
VVEGSGASATQVGELVGNHFWAVYVITITLISKKVADNKSDRLHSARVLLGRSASYLQASTCKTVLSSVCVYVCTNMDIFWNM